MDPDPADVRAAVAGDVAAQSRVLTVVRPRILSYCRAKLVKHPHLRSAAEDIAQEICLSLFKALPRFEERSPIMHLAYRIAFNEMADFYRQSTRTTASMAIDVERTDERCALDQPDDTSGPEDLALHRDLQRAVNARLDRLTLRSRQVLVLGIAFGFTAAEVAALIGSTPGAVRTAQHRALVQLRTALALS